MRRTFLEKGHATVSIPLVQGYVKADGSISTPSDEGHGQYVTTGLIEGGMAVLLESASGYKVFTTHLYDTNGHLLAYRYDYDVRNIIGYNYGANYSIELHKSYQLRVTFVSSTSGASVSPSDHIIGLFRRVSPHFFYRDTDDYAYYNVIRKRAAQMCNNMYTLEANAAGTKKDWQTEVMPYGTKGRMFSGAPYSGVNGSARSVGYDITHRTFTSLVHNPHSLFYTENPFEGLSGYGYSYSNPSNRSWPYGAVCRSLLCAVFNARTPRSELYWREAGKAYTSQVMVGSVEDVQNLKCCDILLKDSGYLHCAIITDLWRDASGRIVFVEVSEAGAGYYMPRMTLKTPAQFFNYITTPLQASNIKVYRQNGQGVISYISRSMSEVEDTPWIPTECDDDLVAFDFNADICTFAGDYATFKVGEKVVLNVYGQEWTEVRIYNYEGTLVSTFNVSPTLDGDGRYHAAVDISSLFASKSDSGCYTATAASVSAESYPTHFEMIYVSLSLAVDAGSHYQCRIDASNNAADLWLYRGASGGGSENDVRDNVVHLSSDQLALGLAGIAYARDASFNYLHLYVRGAYGNWLRFSMRVQQDSLIPTVNDSNWTQGYYLTYNTGEFRAASNWQVSPFLSCIPLSEYAYTALDNVSQPDWKHVVNFYSSADESSRISTIALDYVMSNSGLWKKSLFTAPAGANYMRISCRKLSYKALTLETFAPQFNIVESVGNNGSIEF